MTHCLLFIALLATSIGQSVVMTILPPLSRSVGLTELQVATILSSSALIFAIGTSLWGKASLRYGNKRIIMTGLAGYTAGTVLFVSMFYLGSLSILVGLPLYLALLASRGLQSTIMSATPPAALALAVSSASKEKRLATISKVTSANSFGQVFGPALAGALVGAGLLIPLYAVASITFLALVLIAWKLPDNRQATSSSKAEPVSETIDVIDSTAAPAVGWHYLRYVLISSLLFTNIAMLHQTLAFYFMDNFSLKAVGATQKVGMATMIVAIVSLLMQFGFIQRTQIRQQTILVTGLVFLAMGYLLLSIVQDIAAIYGAMICIGVGMGCCYPAATTLATSSESPEIQNKIAGYLSAGPAMGFVIGPPVAAFAYRHLNTGPFLIAEFLVLLALTVYMLVPSKRS